MSHRLLPHPGERYLTPDEVVERLRDEFEFFEADADQGADDVGDMIAKRIELNGPQEVIDQQVAGRERSYRVTQTSSWAHNASETGAVARVRRMNPNQQSVTLPFPFPDL